MGIEVNGLIYDIKIKQGVSLTAATISFDKATKKIKDSASGLAIFETGDAILVDGSVKNDGYYTVATGGVAAEIVVTEALVDEGAGASVTITSNVYGLMTAVDQAEFRRRANDFAPVISVPGAQLEYSEDVWRPWTMGDFRGGLGQEEWDDPTRFDMMTPGLRIYKDRVTLDTQFGDENLYTAASKGVDFLGHHYSFTGKDIVKRDTGTGAWAGVQTVGEDITDICVYGGVLWVSTWGDYLWRSANGAAWDRKLLPFQHIVRLLNYRKFLWAVSHFNLQFTDDASGDAAWKPTNSISVGETGYGYGMAGMAVIGGIIAFGKTNGIYIYEGSGNLAEGPIIDFENMIYDGNCHLFTVVDGFLYYNVGNRIKRTDLRGSEFDVTPTMTGTTARERYGFGIPVGGQGYQGHIYVAFDDMEGLYPVVLEMPTIDVGGWRMVYKGDSGDTMYGCWFSDVANHLLVNDGAIRSQRFQAHTDAPYPSYEQTAELIGSWFDAGDVWSKKIFAALLAYARDLTGTETISFYYEKDYSGDWVLITTLTSGRENQVPFDPTNLAISARKLRPKIVLSRDAADATVTPVLVLPVVASYIVRPDPTYAQQVMIRVQDNIGDINGKTIPIAASTLKQFLRDCEKYDFPLEYTDRYGAAWDVIISQTQEIRAFKYTDRAGNAQQENVIVVTMKEV